MFIRKSLPTAHPALQVTAVPNATAMQTPENRIKSFAEPISTHAKGILITPKPCPQPDNQ